MPTISVSRAMCLPDFGGSVVVGGIGADVGSIVVAVVVVVIMSVVVMVAVVEHLRLRGVETLFGRSLLGLRGLRWLVGLEL